MSGRAAKISITVDAGTLRDVKKLARRARRSLSSQISEVLARDIRRRRLEEIVAAHEAEFGAITDEELERIRADWRG